MLLRCAALLVLAGACTKPVPLAQDAGPSPLGVVAPDFSCPGPGCEEGGTPGVLRIGASKRSLVPTQYELVNTAYLDARNPSVCDPGAPLLGSGHQHQMMLSAEQQTTLRNEGTLTVQTEATFGHQHEVTLVLADGSVTATLAQGAEHDHTVIVPAPADSLDPVEVWTNLVRQTH